MELCSCGHYLDSHRERVDSTDASAGTHFPCGRCACQDFEQAYEGDQLVGSHALPAQENEGKAG